MYQIRAIVVFSRRKQAADKRFDQFVTDLKILVKDCGFKEEDRVVRDAIVLRSYHPQVQEKCLDEGDKFTLEKAIQIGQNHETFHASLKVIGDDEDAKVHAGRPYGQQKTQRGTEKGQGKPTPKSSQAEARGSAKTTAGACGRCGYPSTHGKCPATDKECIRCHKRGHFAKVCRSKVKPSRPRKFHTVDAWSSDEEYAHLVNAVTDRDAKLGRWWVVVKIDNAHSVKVQLDTGAGKSLLPYNLHQENERQKLPTTVKPPVPVVHRTSHTSGRQCNTANQVQVNHTGCKVLHSKYTTETLTIRG